MDQAENLCVSTRQKQALDIHTPPNHYQKFQYLSICYFTLLMPGSYTVPVGKKQLPEQQQSELGAFTLLNMGNITWKLLCLVSLQSQEGTADSEQLIQAPALNYLLERALVSAANTGSPARQSYRYTFLRPCLYPGANLSYRSRKFE